MRARIVTVVAAALLLAGCEGMTEPRLPPKDDEEERTPPPDEIALTVPAPEVLGPIPVAPALRG